MTGRLATVYEGKFLWEIESLIGCPMEAVKDRACRFTVMIAV